MKNTIVTRNDNGMYQYEECFVYDNSQELCKGIQQFMTTHHGETEREELLGIFAELLTNIDCQDTDQQPEAK